MSGPGSAGSAAYAIAVVVGAASGAIGPFLLLRKMALVGDALSHVALPGIALALMYGIDPFWGVVAFLAGAAFLIHWLEGRSRLSPEALVGILFTASLAAGILLLPEGDVMESLFGAFPAMDWRFLAMFLVLAASLAAASFAMARQFLFRIVSPDLAKVNGAGRGYDLALLLVFAMTVAMGIKLVGTLLMGALTILPASIARNLAGSLRGFVAASTALGALIAVGGVWVAGEFHFPPGPAIVLVGAALFGLSLPAAKGRGGGRAG